MTISFSKCLFSLFFFMSCIKTVSAQTDSLQHINRHSKNDINQQQKPYVILISADGFRHDYATRFKAEHLLEYSQNGVSANSMIPSYPSVTFPNHYSLITGLYPSHHGLVANSYYDRKRQDKYQMSDKAKVRDGSWYGGVPLWVLAEEQEMISASMFWVASEAEIRGKRPTYYYDYNEQISAKRRIEVVKEWLSLPEDRRPHLITFYLSEPDHSGHTYGPESSNTEHAVKMVDSIVYRLTEAVKSTGLPVNFIFVSDHGMTSVDRNHPIAIPEVIDHDKFIVSASGTLVNLYAKNSDDIDYVYKELKKTEKDYKVFLKSDVPPNLHYSASDDEFDRIGDILLFANWPRVFSDKKPGAGYHGFDPNKVKDMHATFFAWGPAFKSNVKIPSFENVNVYPLIARLLGLNLTEGIDGDINVLSDILIQE